MAEIVERIPHKTVAYAFLEIRAGSANEFESIRAEALKKAPHYGFAQERPSEPKTAVAKVAGPEVGPAEATEVAGEAPSAGDNAQEPSPAAPIEGQSPRDKARAKMAAKKEGK